MTPAEVVLNLCQSRKVPVSKMERECGFSNGYIKKLRDGKIPAERVKIISDYFQVPYSFIDPLFAEVDNYYIDNDAREIAKFLYENPDHRVAFDAVRKIKKEDIEFVTEMIKRMSK